ncbi:pollen-specific leucine-rich repeat extensin-like protein 4 [Harmonia axyridis]|uniref:pollen-specific leucine-rich repeat extensin-like protein 4 n=1 Tax=Harmonia axyridis TaxID=115357 RepID=UPI001E277FF1|nr:pollen-specific leucine-rich repeat extensin-like protein 4 [Harmonia axyridis]
MVAKKLFLIFLLTTWISDGDSCNDCCRTTVTTNCCPRPSCCSPCSSCRTVSCSKNCDIECPTSNISRPEREEVKPVPASRSVSPPAQIVEPVPSETKTNNQVSNSNHVNGTSVISLNNTLTNTNHIHVPINITNINTNSIKVDASGGSTSLIPQPNTPIIPQNIPSAPSTPKFIFVLVRQPPVYAPQPPVYVPQPPICPPQPPVNAPQPPVNVPQQPGCAPQTPVYFPQLPMPMPIPQQPPVFIGPPPQNNCCGLQPMGCCSMRPQCSYLQCQLMCSRIC